MFHYKKSNTKEGSNARHKGQKAIRHIENKQHNDRSNSLLINNYF